MTGSNLFSLAEAKDARWRRRCLEELSKRWHLPPEQVFDTLLLEAHLQEILHSSQNEEEKDDIDG